MREYIFHGKRIDNGEWVEGCYIKSVVANNVFAYITPSYPSEPIKVYARTVGQYTGMNDIGGHRIFEGDIMETAIGGLTYHRGVVEFTDGAFGLRCTDGSAYFLCFVAGNYAIIGTVFENADLLEG
jgi:hypothetical protein